MIENPKIVQQAIQDLRKAMGLTQVEFAKAIRKSYPTVQRYEGKVPPPADVLGDFIQFARRANRLDLAHIFEAAFLASLPAISRLTVATAIAASENLANSAPKVDPINSAEISTTPKARAILDSSVLANLPADKVEALLEKILAVTTETLDEFRKFREENASRQPSARDRRSGRGGGRQAGQDS